MAIPMHALSTAKRLCRLVFFVAIHTQPSFSLGSEVRSEVGRVGVSARLRSRWGLSSGAFGCSGRLYLPPAACALASDALAGRETALLFWAKAVLW